MEAHATFTVDGIDHGEPLTDHPGVEVSRARVRKTFSGDLVGTGTVEMMTAFAEDGRGYVAVEWIEGALHGEQGAFALLHLGTQGADGQWGTWRVVPGTGTGALRAITGDAEITIDEDGAHSIVLRYELA